MTEAELFPSLERLAQQRRGKVPFIQQLEWTDCGPACVAMILKYLGRDTTLDEVREVVGGGGRDGADAHALVKAGEHYGLKGRGISIDIDHMKVLPAGTILHWEFNHFVVFEKMTRKGAEIVDPALDAFHAGPALGVARLGHTATAVPGNRVLVAGGLVSGNAWTSTAEMYVGDALCADGFEQ
jgi:hypothetical protein